MRINPTLSQFFPLKASPIVLCYTPVYSSADFSNKGNVAYDYHIDLASFLETDYVWLSLTAICLRQL